MSEHFLAVTQLELRIAARIAIKAIEFAAYHAHFPRGFDAQSNAVSTNANQRQLDFIADQDLFIQFASQDQHGFSFAEGW
jgi:hypothetical protein